MKVHGCSCNSQASCTAAATSNLSDTEPQTQTRTLIPTPTPKASLADVLGKTLGRDANWKILLAALLGTPVGLCVWHDSWSLCLESLHVAVLGKYYTLLCL